MKKALCLCLLLISFLNFSCSKTKSNSEPVVIDSVKVFAKGADISWVTEMEAKGIKFYDKSGAQQDLFALLKSLGFNAIRLRAWVNPTNGYCNTADVVAKALRAKAQGFNIMIDFHYSDWWADPGKQTKPAAWAGQDINALKTSVYNHTLDVLNTLKANSITPEWVQVGNETNDGMLWEEGRASKSMANFAALVSSGYSAVKAVSTSIKVIVHISNGYDNSLFRWMFDGLKANNASYDIIGMSLYPTTTNWADLNNQCLVNMNDMVARYNKPVMIVEVGMDVNSPSVANSFLKDIITKTNSVSGGNGLGVFYWEPECYNWQSYSLSAFDNSGKPTSAMDAFLIN